MNQRVKASNITLKKRTLRSLGRAASTVPLSLTLNVRFQSADRRLWARCTQCRVAAFRKQNLTDCFPAMNL